MDVQDVEDAEPQSSPEVIEDDLTNDEETSVIEEETENDENVEE